MLIIQLEYLILLTLRQFIDLHNSPLIILEGENFYDFLIEQIKLFCKENVKRKLSLSAVCSNIGYSKSFTCKLFKDITGESVFTYFNKLKIEEAKKLLINTTYSATQISDILQFSESKYFNTSFKKIVGISPLQYRKQNTPNPTQSKNIIFEQ